MVLQTVILADLDGSLRLRKVEVGQVCDGWRVGEDNFVQSEKGNPRGAIARSTHVCADRSICYKACYLAFDTLRNDLSRPLHPYRNALLPNHCKDHTARGYRNVIFIVKQVEPPTPVGYDDAATFEECFDAQLAYMAQTQSLECTDKDITFVHDYLTAFDQRYGL